MTIATAHPNSLAATRSQAESTAGEHKSDEPPQPEAGLTIDVVLDDGDWTCVSDVETLVSAVAQALSQRSELKVKDTAATLALSSDAVVARLNGTYRGKPKPTNVLSFPAPPLPTGIETRGEPRALGDIILALETVLSEARDLGVSPEHHVQHLTLHGLLHLLGYDHETDDDATTMETLEIAILATLGVGDPYATGRMS